MTQDETCPNIRLYNGPHKKKLDSTFGIFGERMEVLEEKYILPWSYKDWYQKYKDFETRENDVWVVSFPKAGTTWTQEMIWCILKGLDNEEGKQSLMKRFPFFEFDGVLPEDSSNAIDSAIDDPCRIGDTWSILQNLKDPRTIKSHLPVELLPSNMFSSGAKIVYVCRDPRDVCVSYYDHSMKLDGFIGTFQDFFDLFIKNLLKFGKLLVTLLEKRHWLLGQKKRPKCALHKIYEELHEDLPMMIHKVAKFLGTSVSDELIEQYRNHLSFSSMKCNKAVNNESFSLTFKEDIKFMRKGQVRDWKNHFTKENEQDFQKWTEENLRETDFPYYQDYDT